MRFIVAFALLLLSGCGMDRWKAVCSFSRPGGGAEVRVEEAACGVADCVVRVVVAERGHTTRIAVKSDGVVMFAHGAWSGDVAAVFVDASPASPITVAYDVVTHRAVDFSLAEPWLKDAIVRDYSVTSEELRANGNDALKWAAYPGQCCSRAVDEFRKRHPRR